MLILPAFFVTDKDKPGKNKPSWQGAFLQLKVPVMTIQLRPRKNLYVVLHTLRQDNLHLIVYLSV